MLNIKHPGIDISLLLPKNESKHMSLAVKQLIDLDD